MNLLVNAGQEYQTTGHGLEEAVMVKRGCAWRPHLEPYTGIFIICLDTYMPTEVYKKPWNRYSK
jgi:hypothetical protein